VSQKPYRTLVAALLLLSGSYLAKAATYTATRTGNWNAAATWGQLINTPGAADIVIIPNGFTVTVTTTTAAASTVTVNAGGKLTINNGDKLTIGGLLTNGGTITTNTGSLIIGGSLNNSGSLTVSANGTLTFDGAANSTISSSGGTYSISGTVVLNMATAAIALDVQDANFISGINTGGKYYFTLTRGIFQMDNTGTLNNAYNSGSTNALTIPYGVTIESDNGTMNLATKGTSGNVILSGELLMNGGTVNVQTGATSAQDFRYKVNGGTPQLYVNSGSLNIGTGFNPQAATDYVDFEMTGGTIALATQQQSTNSTFELQNVAGGKTVMSGGLIILEQPDNAASSADLDMAGPNLSTYSVTGGTVQLGISSTPANSIFGINPYSTTNYPNIVVGPGPGETVIGYPSGNLNLLSLYIHSNASFDATGSSYGTSVPTLNITGSDGAYALDDEGTFVPGTNTVEFSGGVSQVITSAALSSVSFYNLTVANTSGNVVLGVATKVTNQLAFTSGELDASADPLTITNGAKTITGVGNSSYVITGDGVTNTGYLAIQGLTRNATTTFPIGTSSYYLPVTLNPTATGTAYSAYVYHGVTTNAKSNGASVSSGQLSQMADITWSVAQTAGAGSANLGLSWASSGTTLEGSLFQSAGTGIGIQQYSGSAWGLVTGSGSVATKTASGTFSGLTQFSVTNINILPLVLGNFNATPQGRTSFLTWAAFPDGQTGSFTIQRSLDGLSWNNIGVVQADPLATVETDYSFTDVAPAAGQNHYRLFIQNEDGSSSYSAIKVVEFSSTASFTVYPNPANTTLTINIGGSGSGAGLGSGSGKPIGFRLVNTAGMVLQSKLAEAGVTTMTMNTSGYPAGVYYLETLDGGQLLQTTTVMVMH
jgi:hypothetical protein